MSSLFRRIIFSITFFLAPGLIGVLAQQHPQQKHFLLNRDVVTLAKAGFPEQVIIDTIQASPSRFDVTLSGLTMLSSQGLAQRVVEAMVVAKACGSQSDLIRIPRCALERDIRSEALNGHNAPAGARK